MEAQPNMNELNLIEMLEVVVLQEIQEQCIYKVPQRIRQHNPKAYTPNIICIGPFHRPRGPFIENNNLYEMEVLKLKYLRGFLNRTNLSVDDLVLRVRKLENQIRKCYAGLVSFNSNDFVNIIIVDACFIIEHFMRWFNKTHWRENYPILSKPYLHGDIFRDLILLENQLPFFVLEEIYQLANINLEAPPLPFVTITTHFFKQFNPQERNPETLRPKHFIDLIRFCLLPPAFDLPDPTVPNEIENVYSVSQLSEAGIVFEVSESRCLLDWKFDRRVFKIPSFQIHDSTERYMRNIIAFEECHMFATSSRYISQYFTILDFLINTEKDVNILVDKKIIVNWMSDGNEAATMINNLCKNVSMSKFNSEYATLCHGLNGFYENKRNRYKAILVHEYFNTPWKIASTITAVFLLLFTLIQAVCSIWSLVTS